MLDDLIEALAALLRCYEDYCRPGLDRKHRDLQWLRCAKAQKTVLAALNSAAAERIDPLIAEQLEAGNAAPGEARKILLDADKADLGQEAELAVRVGLEGDLIAEFSDSARDALQRATVGVPPRDTAEIRRALEALHSRVWHAFQTSLDEPRKRKAAHRNDASEYLRMQLWMIGALVVNAQRIDLFHVSHATSVGMAGVRPLRRRKLKVATCDRPVDANPPRA